MCRPRVVQSWGKYIHVDIIDCMEAAATVEMLTIDRASVFWRNVLHVNDDAAVMERTEPDGDRHADKSRCVVVCNVRHYQHAYTGATER